MKNIYEQNKLEDLQMGATDSRSSSTTKPIFYGTQIVWYLFAILETLLAFRFVLKMAAANSGAWFTSLIYDITYLLAQPFIAVFKVTRVDGNAFEWTTLLAMVVYWLIAEGVVRLFLMSRTISTPEADQKLDRKDTI
jgi:hypothetical protein